MSDINLTAGRHFKQKGFDTYKDIIDACADMQEERKNNGDWFWTVKPGPSWIEVDFYLNGAPVSQRYTLTKVKIPIYVDEDTVKTAWADNIRVSPIIKNSSDPIYLADVEGVPYTNYIYRDETSPYWIAAPVHFLEDVYAMMIYVVGEQNIKPPFHSSSWKEQEIKPCPVCNSNVDEHNLWLLVKSNDASVKISCRNPKCKHNLRLPFYDNTPIGRVDEGPSHYLATPDFGVLIGSTIDYWNTRSKESIVPREDFEKYIISVGKENSKRYNGRGI